MTGDIRWITSAGRYEDAVRLRKEFPECELWVIVAALDFCCGDVARARKRLQEAK